MDEKAKFIWEGAVGARIKKSTSLQKSTLLKSLPTKWLGKLTNADQPEIGWGVAEDPVHIHDLHATQLHLFGLDHKQLTYRFQGRDFRLTDVAGNLVPQLMVDAV